MTSVALFSLSGKPYHAGHHMIIQRASQENDAVILFVSLSDRARAGEVVIRGSDMARIWKDHLQTVMPANVSVVYLVDQSPVKRIYGVLGNVDPESDDVYTVYGDPDDIARNFNQEAVDKYLGSLYNNGLLQFRSLSREETVDISGTQMRSWLQDGNMAEFIRHLPMGVDGQAIWALLRTRLEQMVLSSLASS